MRRRFWLVFLMAVWCAGCAAEAPSRQVQLTMWLVGSEAEARAVNAVAQAFTQRTGALVRCEAVSWGEAHSKYLTAVAGGVQPDIGTMGLTWGAEFGRLGALVDFRQAFPADLQAIQQDTFPGLWASIEQDGRVYGIAYDLTLQTLYYRTDLVPSPPRTWDELTALLDRLGQEHRRMIFDWGNLSWIGYAPFLWQAGGDFYTADHSRAAIDTPAAIQGLAFFRDLYERHGVPRTAIPVEQGLRTGEFPLAISGSWKVISLTVGVPEIAGRWAVATLPRGPQGKGTAFLGGRTIGLFAKSPHREQAWEFIRYLFQPAVQQQLYEAAQRTQDAYLPPNMATWEQLPMDPAMRTVFQQQALEAQGPPPVSGWNEVTHVLEGAIQRVVLRGADPKTELQQVAAAMNAQLARARP